MVYYDSSSGGGLNKLCWLFEIVQLYKINAWSFDLPVEDMMNNYGSSACFGAHKVPPSRCQGHCGLPHRTLYVQHSCKSSSLSSMQIPAADMWMCHLVIMNDRCNFNLPTMRSRLVDQSAYNMYRTATLHAWTNVRYVGISASCQSTWIL